MKRIGHAATAVVCVGALAFAGCGDDETTTSSASGTTTTVAPEEVIASDAKVATGLAALARVAAGIAAISNATASKAASEGLEPVWKQVEGTVKRNAPDVYATIEEDLALLQSGEAEKAKTGAEEIKSKIDEYLAKYPG